jgi:S-formylglutathione hydrolase FrmB
VPRGRLDVRTVHCAALAENPRGDPVDRPCAVYLPEGYDATEARFPVVVLLHAFLGSGPGWFNVAPFAPSILDRLDALFADAVPPFLTVFPDGWTSLGGSQWIDSPGNGAYGQMLAQDVLGHVDRTYRTVPERTGRAVVGRSSGGYGGWQMVRHFPQAFGHMASHSGDSYYEYCFVPEFPKVAAALVRAGGVEPWWNGFLHRVRETRMGGDDHAVVNLLAMSAAYSPDPDRPLGIALPFELSTARIDDAVWRSWLAQDPVRFVPQTLAPFQALSSIFIDCGTRDEYGLRWGARMLAESLRRADVDVVHEEYEDGHMGTTYRFDRSLRFIAPRLAR